MTTFNKTLPPTKYNLRYCPLEHLAKKQQYLVANTSFVIQISNVRSCVNLKWRTYTPFITVYLIRADLFWLKANLLGKHGRDARDLFLLVHELLSRSRLVFICHLLVHARHDRQKVHVLPVEGQNARQGLDKPRTVGTVTPWKVTWNKDMSEWFVCLYQDEKISESNKWINKHIDNLFVWNDIWSDKRRVIT